MPLARRRSKAQQAALLLLHRRCLAADEADLNFVDIRAADHLNWFLPALQYHRSGALH